VGGWDFSEITTSVRPSWLARYRFEDEPGEDEVLEDQPVEGEDLEGEPGEDCNVRDWVLIARC
jgi:hypothetical protein